MVNKCEIKKGIYWVGVVDWNVRNFHGHTYATKHGTTYNSYLIIDEKITLIDTVLPEFAGELIERIRAIVPVEKIDYVVANHVERDHSGSLPEIMKLCPKAKIFGTQKCKEGLYKNYYCNWDFQVVKTGDTLKLGKRTLTFVEAPMIHWPDSMFTYCREEELLMPNDAFGQHFASNFRFDDEVDQCALMDEAATYYANILIPFSSLIQRKIDDVLKMGIPIKMIAPSHGIIWRRDPMKIVNAYLGWAKNETKDKVVIVYETMWRSTEIMARAILEGVTSEGLSATLHDINSAGPTSVVTEMLSAKGYIVGSATHDNGMLPNIAGFLDFLKGFHAKNRIGAAFGSYGWGGGAVACIEKVLKEGGIELAQPSLAVQYVPNDEERAKCFEFGVNFARKCKGK